MNFFMITFGVLSHVWTMPLEESVTRSGKNGSIEKSLSLEEAQVIRNNVYKHGVFVGADLESARPIVAVPKPIAELYKVKPQSVLDLLLRIIDGANPDDSVTAAAYSLALAKGPGGGVACAVSFNKDTYDVLNKNWERTPRAHWIEHVRLAMKARASKATGKK